MSLKNIPLLFLCINSFIFAQGTYLSFHPASFYTYGVYDKNKNSVGYSAYATLGINYYDAITLSYDNTKIIDKNEFNYNQNSFMVSGIKNLYPYYIKANYSYLNGKYNYKPFKFEYSDFTNLYNLSITRIYDNIFCGLSYTFINLKGNKSVQINQPQFLFDYMVSPDFIVSYRGVYSAIKSKSPIYEDFLVGEISDDNRKLISHNISLNWYLNSTIFTKVEVLFGKRSYFFNTDYLTFYNQDDTQNLHIISRIDAELFQNFRINFVYQNLSLDHAKINYYSLGLKYNIWDL